MNVYSPSEQASSSMAEHGYEHRLREILIAARAAQQQLLAQTAAERNQILTGIADNIKSRQAEILAANEKDVAAATNLSSAMQDRLRLSPERCQGMVAAVTAIANQPDPLHRELASWQVANGLTISRFSTAIGCLAVIFESRPNVTIDAAALAIKSGNCALLRPGSESFNTSKQLLLCVKQVLTRHGISADLIAMPPSPDRGYIGAMLELRDLIDLVVPRGGRGLVERVQNEARMPVLAHQEGNCHLYLHHDADPAMAVAVTVNAKMRRTGICGALESLLINQQLIEAVMPQLISQLIDLGCELRADPTLAALDQRIVRATEQDWGREYLAPILSIKTVTSLTEAIAHINQYGSQHTDGIITRDGTAAREFANKINSAIIVHNTSTQFADGGEFGFGAELGIATGVMPPRGPIAANELTSYRYLLSGNGQTRSP